MVEQERRVDNFQEARLQFSSPEAVEQLRCGDEAAWEGFYNITRHGLAIVFQTTGTPTDRIEDSMQESYIKIFKRRETLNPNKDVVSLLITTAYNVNIDEFRKEGRKNPHNGSASFDVAVSTVAGEDKSFDEQAMLSQVRDALKELPVDQRRALLLLYSGFSEYEVGSVEGVSRNTIQTRRRLGLQKLRKIFLHENIALENKEDPNGEEKGFSQNGQLPAETKAAKKRRGREERIEALTAKGYVVLAEYASPYEYMALMKRRDSSKVQVGREVYVMQQDIDEIRGTLASPVVQIANADPTHEALISFAKTWREFERFRVAARQGKIKGIRENRKFFTTQVAIDEYYCQEANRKNIIAIPVTVFEYLPLDNLPGRVIYTYQPK